MENSFFSSPNTKLSPPNSNWNPDQEENGSPEESGWTDYLIDFEVNRQRGDEDSGENSSYMVSESMVSDAGSGPEWKQRSFVGNNIDNDNDEKNLSRANWLSLGGLPNIPKKLKFMRKKRTQELSYDDSLEDTASSPVNSPKITMNFKRMDINSENMDEHLNNYMGKEIAVNTVS